MRWQSAAATPLFDCEPSFQSGVALRFPPQSKKFWVRLCALALNSDLRPLTSAFRNAYFDVLSNELIAIAGNTDAGVFRPVAIDIGFL